MAEISQDLRWSATLNLMTSTEVSSRRLEGDKILLPQSALEEILAAAPLTTSTIRAPPQPYSPFSGYAPFRSAPVESSRQLPNPLVLKLTNPRNGKVAFAGVREFSAPDNSVGVGEFLDDALGLDVEDGKPTVNGDDSTHTNGESMDIVDERQLTVAVANLPKGTYVRLRPLEAGYNPDDWKSLLERQLRKSYTTLTRNSTLSVRGSHGEAFRFLVDKFVPEGDGICVVDTDLEVDIEALNEEQARETMRRIADAARIGSPQGNSRGGEVDIWKPVAGQVVPGSYVDFTLPSWDRTKPITIELSGIDEGDCLDLFVSPWSTRHRSRPREADHVFADFDTPDHGEKRIVVQPTNVELVGSEKLLISVFCYAPSSSSSSNSSSSSSAVPEGSPRKFTLRTRVMTPDETPDISQNQHVASPEEEQCKNCLQWVPKRTIVLHENFCRRNNVLCSQCKSVFQKNSPEWAAHWHCPHDEAFGNSAISAWRHQATTHEERQCESCGHTAPSLRHLAAHRTTTCPEKLILCKFCHLEVPQEGDPENPSAETILTGLTAHEVADGARTTECHLCNKIVRMKDMETHLKHHDLDKATRDKPLLCRNVNCGRTLYGVGSRGDVGPGNDSGRNPNNDLGLCSICFGPLYASVHDPEGKALRRRVERRYLGQLMTGCGKSWCSNEFCRTGRANGKLEPRGTSVQATLPIVKPLMLGTQDRDLPMYFCVDERSQTSRFLAGLLESEGKYDIAWCVAACEAANGEMQKAQTWLESWAKPKDMP